jgi:hypothetical protein
MSEKCALLHADSALADGVCWPLLSDSTCTCGMTEHRAHAHDGGQEHDAMGEKCGVLHADGALADRTHQPRVATLSSGKPLAEPQHSYTSRVCLQLFMAC